MSFLIKNIQNKLIYNSSVKLKWSLSKRPFTFLELMIVVIIVAVMAAVAMPRFNNFYENLKLDSNARQLKLFFEYAKNTALNRRTDCVVFYVAAKKEFQLKYKYKKSKFEEVDGSNNIYEDELLDNYNLINVSGLYGKLKLANGISLVNAQEMGALPIPQNVDFNFDISPYGIENAYKFTLGNTRGDEINVVVMAGSGIPKIFKMNSNNFYGQ